MQAMNMVLWGVIALSVGGSIYHYQQKRKENPDYEFEINWVAVIVVGVLLYYLLMTKGGKA